MYDYVARAESDISFKKNNPMEVINDTGSTDWYFVLNLISREEGWIPREYVAAEKSLNSEEYVVQLFAKKIIFVSKIS